MTPAQLQEPVVKLLYNGPQTLSDRETISLIIGGQDSIKKAANALSSVGNDFNKISNLSYQELKKLQFSHLQAIRLIAVIEFTKRKDIHSTMDITKIARSDDARRVFTPYISDLQHEEFWIMLLNRQNSIIKLMNVSKGGISGTTTDIRIIIKEAILNLASGIIIAHNHPSGNTTPSESDIRITRKIKEAACLCDVQLLDHIIITSGAYHSFADNGEL